MFLLTVKGSPPQHMGLMRMRADLVMRCDEFAPTCLLCCMERRTLNAIPGVLDLSVIHDKQRYKAQERDRAGNLNPFGV